MPQAPAGTGSRKPSVLEQAGGTKGLAYTALPALVFVVANNFRGLRFAVIASIALAVGIAAERIAKKESLQPALGGLFGVAVAAGISWYTGSAKDYFLIGIWASLGGAVLFLASVLVRRPLAGVLWNSATGKGNAWRDDRRSRRAYDIATLTLAAIFAARFAVQQYFYETDAVESLGAAKIIMGYPLLAVGLLAVAWAARTSDKRLKTPAPRPANQA
ncbi:DUF3159 domain-containing protein [Streptomyces olivaceus]|uniref:DUF3159 domain-containing protein n=2 Tax=Streptomyces TaxID=1883 RepID=A0ABS7VX80_STROV|nr:MULTISPECIES: DUF3159 domain-containing protein [Streptomyces]MBZ6086762.1 DUF3159 domain-containing protein [Streptomyces olivaceus]MBZ6094637.1 DUF3159 domain-containing protein [Streptomyces olivaceus]MBZ6108088.1 DUF3159 domain-containing protein [Streptomyces olivaceus]MBZ6115753.1 DUF3159 domain-containing protein [Streptomyces olivaceus]MBZ6121972.1 DUF3159 domain-containing protein [Streptomyces olivaceus]